MVLKSMKMEVDVVHSSNEVAGEASIDTLIPSYMINSLYRLQSQSSPSQNEVIEQS